MTQLTVKAGTTCAICLRSLDPGANCVQEQGTDRIAHQACAVRLFQRRGLAARPPGLVPKVAIPAPVIPDLAKRFWKN